MYTAVQHISHELRLLLPLGFQCSFGHPRGVSPGYGFKTKTACRGERVYWDLVFERRYRSWQVFAGSYPRNYIKGHHVPQRKLINIDLAPPTLAGPPFGITF